MTSHQQAHFLGNKHQALHFCSDGMPFPNKADAEAHAAGLEDKTVESVSRNGEQPATEEEAGGKEDGEPPATKRRKKT